MSVARMTASEYARRQAANVAAKRKKANLHWTPERIAFLVDNYPAKGKKFCMDALGMTDGQVRSRASLLKLRAMGFSEAWHNNNAAHSVRMTGRKRPDQSEVMRQMHAQGKFALSFTPERRAAISSATKARIKANGHPRGAAGMRHSEETKQVISEKSRAANLRRTPEQQQEKSRKMVETKMARGNLAPPRPNASWKAGWREIGGKRNYYRSRWEANYARYLEWLKCSGQVIEWAHEPDVFWFEGIKRGCVSYLPDFKVTVGCGVEYHEVKGWMDDRSKTKIRRMAKYHPGVTLVVVGAKQYQEIKKKMAALIVGWEP